MLLCCLSGQGQAQILLDTSLRGSPSPWPAEASREALKCQCRVGAEVSVGASTSGRAVSLGPGHPQGGCIQAGPQPTASGL